MTTDSQRWAVWLNSPGMLDGYGYLMVIHAGASLLVAAGAWFCLPMRYRRPLPWAPLLLFSIPFFIPLVGALGVIGAAIFARTRRKRQEPIWRTRGVPSLPLHPPPVRLPSPLFHDGGLEDVLHLASDPAQRLEALLMTTHMEAQACVPMLKLALRDSAEEVRLLAGSMLEGQESQINQRIETLLSELSSKEEGAEIRALHGSLANWHWELAYLGLAQGSGLEHALSQAATHVEASLLSEPDPEVQLLGGRIALQQGDVKKARNYFTLAERGGMEAEKLLPFLAETAFMDGDYAQVPRLLAAMPPAALARSPFAALTRYWL